MITFEQFVKSLGPNAQRYTTAELRQLHIDVRKMARILLEGHRERFGPVRSPQASLDALDFDRTLEEEVNQPDDESPSPVDQL